MMQGDPMPLRRLASKSYGNGRYPFQLSVNLQASFSETSFHYVTDIKEVLALALTNEKVNDAIDFNITNQKTEEKK